MSDQARIEHELTAIVREIGDIRDCAAWARIIIRNMQQMGATCLADLTIAQLLQAITDAEQAMCGLDVSGDTLRLYLCHRVRACQAMCGLDVSGDTLEMQRAH